MPDVMKRQRETRRKIIRQWMRLSKDKRQSINEISHGSADQRGSKKGERDGHVDLADAASFAQRNLLSVSHRT